jgi:hypothetical protein
LYYELISSHTGRRTWNTKAEKSGKNLYAAMKAAGHSSPEVHARYVRFSLDESIDELKGIWDEDKHLDTLISIHSWLMTN